MADKLNKIIKRFALIFFIGITIVFVIYCFFISSPTKIFKSFFNDDNKELLSEINNINGIYSRKEDLNTTYSIYSSCSISSINYYILVMNDKYNYYESSCLITKLLATGKVSDLDIKEENNNYSIKYKNNIYNKDISVDEIIPQNGFFYNHQTIEIKSINYILRNLKSSNDLFDFSSPLKSNPNTTIDFKKVDDSDYYSIIIKNIQESNYSYEYTFNDFNTMPYFYSFGKSYIALEPLKENDNYKYNLKLINTGYNLKNQFPITIDGKSINYDEYNVFIYFDIYANKFRVFFSKYNDFCGDESDEESIIYYEFNISYNYSKVDLNKPEFVKVVKAKDNCNEIKKLMKEK